MDLAATQAKISAGYGRLAAKIGTSYGFHRQLQPTADFDHPFLRRPVAVDSDPTFTFRKTNLFGNAIFYGAFDSTRVQPGDYLVGDATYFVADLSFPKPPMIIRCNAVLTFWRSSADVSGDPDDDYESSTSNNRQGTALATGWPASLLAGSRGEKATMDLPLTGREPWVTILVPTMPVTVAMNDYAADQDGNRYMISDVESSHLGLRITAQLAED